MDFGEFIVYADESGDHSLDAIDRDFPIFVLDFCIFRKEQYATALVPRVQKFKFRHFGYDLVILHEHDMRKQRPPFLFLKSESKRTEFMNGLNEVIREAEFIIIAAVIDKQKLTDRYRHPDNPYEIALKFCMEQAFAFLRDQGEHLKKTHIIVEKRGHREDDILELAFRRVRDGDNQWGPMPGLEIVFVDKRANSTGLQLADLTVRPIGRHVLNPGQTNRAYDLIEPKFRRSPGGLVNGWGLKVFH